MLSSRNRVNVEKRPSQTVEGALVTRDDDVAAELKDLGVRLKWVPMVRVEAAAGTGITVHPEDELETGGEWMSETYIRRRYDVAPHRLRSMRVQGDSMYDTIRSGEIIRVAMMNGEPIWDSAVYVVHTPTGLVVKRIRLPGDGIMLWSDNPDVPNRTVSTQEWDEEYRLVALVLEVMRAV